MVDILLSRVHGIQTFVDMQMSKILGQLKKATMIQSINLAEKFELFEDQWTPKIIGELNGQYVKLAKLEGEFMWHSHQDEDELFMVIKGTLIMHFRDKIVETKPGEILIVPRGIEHLPETKEEVWVMLFEPKETKHTGMIESERTVYRQDWI